MPKSEIHQRHRRPHGPDPGQLDQAVETLRALGGESRLRLLLALREGEQAVGELAELTGISPAACSQQLRVLRNTRLVSSRRLGQTIRYRLYDDHLAALLDEVLHHAEHAQREWAAPPAASDEEAVSR